MTVVVSHPTGNANLRAVLRSLAAKGLLEEFVTTVAIPPRILGNPILSQATRRRLGQRCFVEADWGRTRITPFREVTRLAARRLGLTALTRHELGWAAVDAVYRDVDLATASRIQRASPGRLKAVYAYEDGALETFRVAKAKGVACLYDLPIAHWRSLKRLLEEEAQRLPEWAPTMEGLLDSAKKHARKDEEIALADQILVASSFTRNSLTEHFGDSIKVTVVPYGCPTPTIPRPSERLHGAPLRLFYAGHLAQRKGIADLIEATRRLQFDWHLTLAGPLPATVPPALREALADPRVDWLGVVPHATLLERMSEAHVFVFPSIVEGFGMVITEAMASGLPVVTTPNTAGPDIIESGREGIIVPIRDPDAIATALTRLAEDEELRRGMAERSLETAHRLSWETYEARISELVTMWIGH